MTQESKGNKIARRNFIGSSAVLSGFLLSSLASAQSADELNVAVIGTGAQGQLLINNCVKIPGIRIQAICDIWENYNLPRASQILTGFQQEHKTYTDYQDMLGQEKDLHAVLIATPDFCHAQQTEDCLRAGLHVYCESAMSNTIEGAKKMAQAAKETGKLLQIGFQRRSNPRYHFCLNHILNETQLCGEITAVNGQWNRPVQSDRGFPRRSPIADDVLKKYGYDSMQQFRNWTWYKNLGGGPLVELGMHQIDVFNWYLNSLPKSVMATGGVDYYDPATHELCDTVMVAFDYPTAKRNVRAFYQTINNNSNFGYLESFLGDQGTLYISEAPGRVKVYREPSAPDWDKWVRIGYLELPQQPQQPKKADDPITLDIAQSVIPPEYNISLKPADSAFRPHLENFFNTVRGNGQLTCPAEIAYTTTVAVLKVYESIATSKKVELKPEDFQI